VARGPPVQIPAHGTRIKGRTHRIQGPSSVSIVFGLRSPTLQRNQQGVGRGFEQDLLDNRVTAGAIWFDNRFEDMIDYSYALSI